MLRALWEEPRANLDGEFFTLTDALCEPKPLQSPLPIWIGGVGEKRTLQLVARYAQGWNAPYLTIDQYHRLSGVLDEWCERVDRDPLTIKRDVNLSFHLAATEADRPRAVAHFEEVFGPAGDAFRQRGAILGTPDEAIELLMPFAEAGVNRVNITLRPPWDWDALHAFASEVIPVFS